MQGEKGWLLIPVEVQVRELLGRLLVGAVAARRGYHVLVGHDRVVRRLARHLPRGIMFDKSLGASGDRKVRRYARLGYTITAIDEESTGFYPNPDMYLSTRLSRDSLDRAARWFCISDRLRDEAARRYPEHEDAFVTTGLPRTDIWRPQFHGLYAAERDRIRDEIGPFILFCSNFGAVIHARSRHFVQQQFDKQEKAYSSAAAYQAQIIEQGRRNLDAFIEVLPKLAQWFANHRIVIRPHPSESRDVWRALAAGMERVEVRDEGLATPWILAADCLFHHGCTTGIEAELLGRPHVMYAPYPDHHHDSEVMRAFAPIVGDEAGLRNIMTAILGGDRSQRKDRHALETYYASLMGPLASSRIVEEFDRLGRDRQRDAGDLPAWLSALRFAPRHLVASYWPRSARARAYSRQKWQGAGLDAINQALELIAAGAGLDCAVEATEPFPQLFRLRLR